MSDVETWRVECDDGAVAEARAANANFIEHIEAANGLAIRALR